LQAIFVEKSEKKSFKKEQIKAIIEFRKIQIDKILLNYSSMVGYMV